MAGNKKVSIDVGLEILCRLQHTNQTLSLEDIAEVCECTVWRIVQIQNSALQKLKKERLMLQYFNDSNGMERSDMMTEMNFMGDDRCLH